MRHYGRRGGRRRSIPRETIQHSPSLIGNAPAAGIALLHVFAHADNLASPNLTQDRTGGEDRFTAVDNGRRILPVTIDISILPGTGQQGVYEYAIVKYERSTSVPAIGVDPVPSSADIVASGLQGAVRGFTPGYVVNFGLIPVTSETTTIRKIKVNFAKFKKAKVRDGDYYTIIMYNRTQAGGTYDLQFRYYTSS